MAEAPKIAETATTLAALSLDEAITRSHALLDRVLSDLASEGKAVTAVCVLFSGGNDSTVLVHLLRGRATHAVHINTGIGVEETRRFVRCVSADLGLPLIEEHPPPGCTYDELVLRFGFPGPAGHQMMFSRLKERGLRAVRRRFVTRPRRERVVFCAGMRLSESARRWRNTNEVDREGSIVWVSPIAHWTDAHMREYRERFAVPENPVSAVLHMSGECLCGAFAKPGELAWVEQNYPEVGARIRDLEARAREAGVHCVWGTRPPDKSRGRGAEYAVQGELLSRTPAGRLCAACVSPGPETAEEAIAELLAANAPAAQGGGDRG